MWDEDLYGDPAAELAALQGGAAVVNFAARGRLLARGKDARDLLQRLTTNDVLRRPPNAVVRNVFPNQNGKIIDAPWCLLGERGDWLLVSAGAATAVREWIDEMTFREDLEIGDESASHGELAVIGPRAADAVAGLDPSLGGVAAGTFRVLEVGGEAVLLAHLSATEGFRLVAPAAIVPALGVELLGHGVAKAAGPEAHEWWRVAQGLPAYGHELTRDYNPHEARLGAEIDWKKGCYVGQEVIARLDTYKKVQRQLVRLALAQPVSVGTPLSAGPWAPPQVGGEVPPRVGGEPIGVITSVAECPGAPHVAALAYVKVAFAATPIFLAGECEARLVPWV